MTSGAEAPGRARPAALPRAAVPTLGPMAKVGSTLRIASGLSSSPSPGGSPGARDRDRASRFHAACVEVCDLHGIEIHVSGEIPRRPCVLVANHRSFIDPLLVGARIPCAPVAKIELAGWPVLGRAASGAGALFVRRDDPNSGAQVLRRARRRLERGVSVLTFPEGTTSDGAELRPFRRGIFGIAAALRVPIYPVFLDPPAALDWVGDDYFLPHYWRFARRPRTDARLIVGAPLLATPGVTASQLAEGARAAIEGLRQIPKRTDP